MPELKAVPDALVVRGDAVANILTRLADEKLVDLRRFLIGFPHPSGANGHRKARYEAARRRLAAKARSWLA